MPHYRLQWHHFTLLYNVKSICNNTKSVSDNNKITLLVYDDSRFDEKKNELYCNRL